MKIRSLAKEGFLEIQKKEILNHLYSDDNKKTKSPTGNKKSKMRSNKRVVTRANPYNRELYDPDAVEVQRPLELRKNQPEEEYEEAKDQSGVFKNLPEVQHHTTNDEEGITNISKGIINRSHNQQDQDFPNTAVKKKTVQNYFDECELMRLTMKTHITPNYAGPLSLIYSFENFDKSRKRLIAQYKKIVLKDLKFAYEHKVDNKLWQDVFYKVIKSLQEELDNRKDEEKLEVENKLKYVYLEAIKFYTELLENLAEQQKINLPYLPVKFRPRQSSKEKKRAIIMLQRITLSIADLHRYQIELENSYNYATAKRWYEYSSKLDPRNSWPYNQLAKLAYRTQRYLQCCYYYIRSASTDSNPVLSARDELKAIFNSSNKLIEKLTSQEEKIEKEKHAKETEENKKKNAFLKGRSNHVWILPDYALKKDKNEFIESKNDQIEDQNADDLLKKKHARLTHTFLHLHGILFMRIGFENFPKSLTMFVHLLNDLLLDNLQKFDDVTMTHFFAINVYTVENYVTKTDDDEYEDNCTLIESALELFFKFFSVVCDHIEVELSKEDVNSIDNVQSIDLVQPICARNRHARPN